MDPLPIDTLNFNVLDVRAMPSVGAATLSNVSRMFGRALPPGPSEESPQLAAGAAPVCSSGRLRDGGAGTVHDFRLRLTSRMGTQVFGQLDGSEFPGFDRGAVEVRKLGREPLPGRVRRVFPPWHTGRSDGALGPSDRRTNEGMDCPKQQTDTRLSKMAET